MKSSKPCERNEEIVAGQNVSKNTNPAPLNGNRVDYSHKHDFCYFEFSKKGSCRKGENCSHSHDIPDYIRQDKVMKKRIKEERSELWRRNIVLKKIFPAQEDREPSKLSSLNKTPCGKSFIKQGSCKDNKCPDNHNLDYVKIRNGICFVDFEKQGSCTRGTKCKFMHETPPSLRMDSNFSQSVSRRKQDIGAKKQQQMGKDLSNDIDVDVNVNDTTVDRVFSPGSLSELTKLVSNQMSARK